MRFRGNRYYWRFGDRGRRTRRVWGESRAWITGTSLATRIELTCGARKRVGRARCIRFRPVHYFCGDAPLYQKTRSPACLPRFSLLPSLALPLQSIPSETTHVSFSAFSLSDGGFVFAGDKHRLRAKCARLRLLEIAQVAYSRYSSCFLSHSFSLSLSVLNSVCVQCRLFGSISALVFASNRSNGEMPRKYHVNSEEI